MQQIIDAITADLDGLLYISESEAPVELLHWPEVCTLEAAQQKIAATDGTAPETQTLQSVADFLAPIQKMAVPEDPMMQEYAQRWKDIFRKMEEELCQMQVILGPVKDAQQQIYIVGFVAEGALALHTSAIIT